MTRVRMRTLYAGPNGIIPEGKVGDVDEETAAALVAGDYAVRVDAVETAEAPPAPETAAKTGKRARGKPAPPETAEAPPAPESDDDDGGEEPAAEDESGLDDVEDDEAEAE